MNFSNATVAARYKMTSEKDVEINIAGQYKGLLSKVSKPEIVQAMVARGNTLVEELPKKEQNAAAKKIEEAEAAKAEAATAAPKK